MDLQWLSIQAAAFKRHQDDEIRMIDRGIVYSVNGYFTAVYVVDGGYFYGHRCYG